MAGSINFNFRPSSPDLDAVEYFAEYRAQLSAHKATLAPAEDDDAAEEFNKGYAFPEVLSRTEVEAMAIKAASMKRYITAAVAGGFTVRAAVSETLEQGLPFTSGAKAGQTRADRAKKHTWIFGTAPGAAFRLHYEGGSLKESVVWDVAGWPTELFFDYTPSYLSRKTTGMSEADGKLIGERRGAEYNDGEMWVNHHPRTVTTAAEFEEWFADFVEDFEPRKKAVRKTKEETADAMVAAPLMEGVWIG